MLKNHSRLRIVPFKFPPKVAVRKKGNAIDALHLIPPILRCERNEYEKEKISCCWRFNSESIKTAPHYVLVKTNNSFQVIKEPFYKLIFLVPLRD